MLGGNLTMWTLAPICGLFPMDLEHTVISQIGPLYNFLASSCCTTMDVYWAMLNPFEKQCEMHFSEMGKLQATRPSLHRG